MRREGRKGRKGSDGKGREEKRGKVFNPRKKFLAPPLLYVTYHTYDNSSVTLRRTQHSDNFNVDYYGYCRSPPEQLSYSSSVALTLLSR